mgnify:FL=1
MQLVGLKKPPLHGIYHALWSAADWLYPPNCGGCGKFGQRWCPACQAQVQIIQDPVCPQCGNPQPKAELCPSCRHTHPPYAGLRSWAAYREPLRHAIHQLKYAGDMGIAESFGNSLLSVLEKQNWNIECIVPVPLNPHRQVERGYNQSMLLALPLATALRLPLRPQALLRKRDTLSQTKLSAQERKQNLLGAFQAQAKYIRNQTVLLIDDVTTTGATLWACAQALLEAGAKSVYGLTLARSLLQADSPEIAVAA